MAPRIPRKPTTWWDEDTTTPSSTKPDLSKLDEAELREVIRKADQVRSRAATMGVPEQTTQQIISTGERPDVGFARLKQPAKGFGGFLKNLGGLIVPDVLDVSDIPLPGTDKNLGEGIKGVGERVLFGTDAGTAAKAQQTGEPEKRKFSVASVLAPPYKAYQAGWRFWLGMLKEADEELAVLAEKLPGVGGPKRGQTIVYPSGRERGKAGFQWSEVLDVYKDPNAGFGNTLWSDRTGNPYIDQIVGFLGEVFVDPVNLLSAGVGGTALKATAKTVGLAPDAFKAAEAASGALRAQGSAAIAREVAKESLDAARAAGDTAAVRSAQQVLDDATARLADATRVAVGPQAPRVGGRTGAQALGQKLIDMRNDAAAVLRRPDVSPEQAALAKYTVDVITDDVIARTASRGFAGLIPDLKTAFKAPSPAEALLGVTGELRLGLPGKKVAIPGTGRITRPISYGVQAVREATGQRLLGGLADMIPTGEGGLFPAGFARSRAQVRAGLVEPQDIVQKLEIERLDKRFRGRRVLEAKNAISTMFRYGLTKRQTGAGKVGNVRRALGVLPDDAGFTKADLQTVLPYVTDSALSRTALNAAQKKALDAIEGVLGDFLRQAQDVAAVTGREITPRANYFPQMLSDEAIAVIRKGGMAADIAERNMKIDRLRMRGNFIQRELGEGDEFFGVELTADDLKGGVLRLNQIAREGGWKYGNFFEEDVLTVLQKYANKHADDIAQQRVLAEAPDVAPSAFARELKEAAPPRDFDPDRVARGFAGFAKSLTGYGRKADEIDTIIDVLQINMDDLKTYAARGTYDDATLKSLQDIFLREAEIALNFAITGLRESAFDLSTKRFAASSDILDRGFVAIKDQAPEIFAPPQVQELFTAVKRAKEPGWRTAAAQWYRDKLSFIKAYQLATPRQVMTNMVGNFYMMTMAGNAKIANLFEGAKVFKAITSGIREGKTIDDVAKELVASGVAKNAEDIVNAYALYGSAGFGRYAEIAEELGGEGARRGIMQTGPSRGIPGLRNVPIVDPVSRAISNTVGAVPQQFRRLAQGVEEAQRFEFMYDGIKQGLSPEEAAARVQFYLFDYQDLSKLDDTGKLLFPYWMWMSRNTPLQLVVQATRPRAYAFTDKFRRATEQPGAQEYGSETYEPLPPYQRERGAFVTKEMEGFGAPLSRRTVDLGLPIVGAGEKNLFTEFLRDYESGLVAPLSPIARLPLELYANRIAAFKSPIVYDNDVDPTSKQLEYVFRQSFGMPLSLFSRYIASVPQARRQEVVQVVFDLRYDENQPGEQAFASAARILGFPITPVPRDAVKASTIKQNTKELEAYLKDKQKVLDAEEQERIRKVIEGGTTPPTTGTGGTWWDTP